MMPSNISCLFSVVLVALFSGCTTGSNSGHFMDDRPQDAALRMATKHQQMETFSKSMRFINGELAAKYDLARHFQRMGSHVIAVEVLNEILSMNPGYVEARNAMGYSLDCIGDYSNARQHYKAAIALNPELDYAYNNLGYSYLLAGDYRSAIAALEKAISLNESNQKYIKNLGYAYFRQGNPVMAENTFDRLDDHHVAERIRTQLGLVFPRSNMAHGSRMEAQSTAEGLSDTGKNERSDKSDQFNQSAPVTDELTYLPLISEAVHATGARDALLNVTIDSMDFLVADDAVAPENGRSAVIEVSNGNGVRRMARSVGDFLERNGMRVTRLTNADHFEYQKTILFYGKGEADQAMLVAGVLPGDSRVRMVELDQSGVRVKILMGADMVF